MRSKNWSNLVLLASIASCSISLGSPVAEGEAVSRYGRGYSGHRGFGYSRSPRVYSGPYNTGYGGRYGYASGRQAYHRAQKKHNQHQQVFARLQSQRRFDVVPQQKEVDRFVPAELKETQQRIFIIDEEPVNQQVVSPSFSVEIDFNGDDTRDIVSDTFVQEPFTNSVDNVIPIQQVNSEPEELVFNFPSVPAVENVSTNSEEQTSPVISRTQQRLIDRIQRQKQQQAQDINSILDADSQEQKPAVIQSIPKPQNPPQPIPTKNLLSPGFKFPPRILAEQPAPSPVQQPLVVQAPVPALPPPVLPQAIPAVPGRPVLAAGAVQPNAVQTVQNRQSSFIPMPVPAVPMLSN